MAESIVNLRELKNYEVCERKGVFSKFEFFSKKNKYYYLAILLKRFWKKYDLNLQGIKEARSIFNDIADDILSYEEVFKFELDAEVEMLKKMLLRYIAYELTIKRRVVEKGISDFVEFEGKKIKVTADVIFAENEKSITIARFKRGKRKLTTRVSSKNSVDDSMELFLMKKLGEKLYPTVDKVYPEFIHMKGKKDKSKKLLKTFDADDQIINSIHKMDVAEIKLKNVLNEKSKKKNLFSTSCSNDCNNCEYDKICNYEQPEKITYELRESSKKKEVNTEVVFTDAQKKAIEFDFGVARINAGAGAGKTSVLANRFIHLIKKGVKPEDILMITFTNKGAEEMKEKVMKYADDSLDLNYDSLRIYTFNSFGNELIMKYYERLGFTKKPNLADKVDRYNIIASIINDYEKIEGLDYNNPVLQTPYYKGSIAQIDYWISTLLAKNKPSIDEIMELFNVEKEKATKIYLLFYRFLDVFAEKGFIQYQDQVNYSLSLLRNYQDIADEYCPKHLMVDEFQDTDDIQMNMVTFMYKHLDNESLMVVGDDSQAIFSFRFVSPENIVNFKDVFPFLEDINMVKNFRSTPEIIQVANALNSYNKEIIIKNLVSQKAHGKKPVLIHSTKKDYEYKYLALKIKELIDNGREPHEIAFIARTKKELSEMQDYLRNNDVPAIMHVSKKYINNMNVQAIGALGEFLLNPRKGDIKILTFLNARYHEKLQLMKDSEILDFLLEEKVKIYAKYKNLYSDKAKKDFFNELVKPLEEDDLMVEEFFKLLDRRRGSFEELMEYLEDFIKFESNETVNIATKEFKAVTLITAHNAKGKEYPVVFNSLNKYQFKKEKSVEEERRLAFVSFTRAEDELYISYSDEKLKHQHFEKEIHYVDRIEISKVTKKMAEEGYKAVSGELFVRAV